MKLLGNVIKSASDNRIYKAIQLPNKLECLIVCDKEAEKSSSSLSVEAGSLQDPIETQGLAHYLQHMLFMGTEKYPNENEYSEFLAKNSGSSNAYTDQLETNYFFQVSSVSFKETLDRFAQFFISPIMAEGSSERQMNAVHSEHTKNLLNDAWRDFQIWKNSTKKDHPLNKFSTGDKNTLNVPNVRDMLLSFYKKNYSANLMKLVVYGKQDVQNMLQYVNQVFGGIPNQELNRYKMEEIPFDESNLGNLYRIVPIKSKLSSKADKNKVSFMWILSSYQQHYKNSPGKYLSHLIGHEGPGSLLSLLIKEGLALELSAGSQDNYKCFTKLQVTVILTDKGLNSIELIAGYLMHYIEMLKKDGPQKWVFEEIKEINRLKFDNFDKKHGMSVCSRWATTMHNIPVELVLAKDYLMEEWKPELISNYLHQLTVKNLRITIHSQKFAPICTQTCPIYGTKFSVEPLPQIQPILCNVSLPPKNTFFPTTTEVRAPAAVTTPVRLDDISNDRISVYFKPDHRFQLAKGHLKIRFYYQSKNTPKDKLIQEIYKQLLSNFLRELEYMAEMAYVNCNFDFHINSVDVEIKGFNDSLTRFVAAYLDKFFSYVPDDQVQFENLKSKKQKECNNFFFNIPYQQAYEYHCLSLREGLDVDPRLKRQEIGNITFQQVINFGKKWKEQLFCQMYIAGNFVDSEARQFAKDIEANMAKINSKPLPKGATSPIRAVVLKENEIWAIEQPIQCEDEQNSCLIVHFQYEELGVITKLLQDLCMIFIKEPAFDYLRTKQQLGYIVTCLPDDNRGVLGISILVQSNIKASHELRKYIDNLMKILHQNLNNLTVEEFEKIKHAALVAKSQKDKDLASETTRFWGEIVKHTLLFTRQQDELNELQKITLEEFKNFFVKIFYKSPKCFQTHLFSKSKENDNKAAREGRMLTPSEGMAFRIAPSVEWFKKRMPLFPDYYALL